MGRNIWVKQLREEDGDLVDVDNDPLTGTPDPEEQKNTKREYEPRVINIGGKATVLMGKGDRLIIETPGGGAWGALDSDNPSSSSQGLTGSLGSAVKGVVEWAARGSLAERAAAQAGF